MNENQNTQSGIADPYASITESEGVPFVVRRNSYNRQVTSVVFNQSWNAAFMAKRYHIHYYHLDRSYGLYKPSENFWEPTSEDRMCTILAEDLAEYWRKFHPELAEELLPRRTNAMLRASVRMLRNRIRKD
jgi:hypothetical protein